MVLGLLCISSTFYNYSSSRKKNGEEVCFVMKQKISQSGAVLCIILHTQADQIPLAYVHTHATCDMRRATCDFNIFAANTFSYTVHTLATCDMRPQHEGGWGNGWKWEGNHGMGEKLRKKSIFLYNVCCSSNHRIALICSVDCCKMYCHYIS